MSAVPPLSVVMPVHNALPHLDATIRSILSQSWADFEFVIGDDGSTDGSGDLLHDWAKRDQRIRLLQREGKSGHSSAGNWVVSHARAPLIARTDADDLSYPQRFQRQMEIFQQQPEADLVGTAFDSINERGEVFRPVDYWRLLRNSVFAPFPHSSAMFTRASFNRAGGYRQEASAWEDLDLYLRIARHGRILVIPEVLVSLRHAQVSTRLRTDGGRMEETFDRMYRSVEEYARAGDYESVLHEPLGPNRKLHPMSFVALGALRLWSGVRPEVLHRMMKRAKLGFNMRSAQALCWASWSSVHPPSLRLLLLIMLRLRNLGAGPRLERRRWIEWSPGGETP